MAKLAFLFWLTATSTVFATPAEDFSLLNSRACTTPANSLKNPSFESNGLSSWAFKPTYANLGSATIVTSGYKSNHAVQVGATSGSEDPTSYNKLQQTFKTCKASIFQLSWSMYLPKDGAQYTAPRTPGMSVSAIAPDGLSYQLASFNFGTKSYNGEVYTPNKKGPFKVGEWVNFVADFPNSKTGTWTISMEWYAATPVSGGKTSKLKLKLDNFTVKLK
ncbi:hypothetical protein FHETE_2312 [Fusarium heterosporum]|uniref:Uncharacterized protein n=1 Tax=Fusarium heterosporum TaxID=42747 RepID=A0A8H5TVD3_FUSHE|nr:hypothetical protein FHETE_2312 [Fusarium heterosporum]